MNEQELKKEEAIVSHFAQNFATLFASVVMAYFLAKSGILAQILTKTVGSELIGAFVAGIFFTSLVSAAPSLIALATIAQNAHEPLWVIALIGGLGSLVGDLIIYAFIKTHVSDELYRLTLHPAGVRVRKLMHLRSMRWLFACIGAVIIASPLPDELGLTLMGVGKVPFRYIAPLSFVLNALGIYLVGLVAQGIAS